VSTHICVFLLRFFGISIILAGCMKFSRNGVAMEEIEEYDGGLKMYFYTWSFGM